MRSLLCLATLSAVLAACPEPSSSSARDAAGAVDPVDAAAAAPDASSSAADGSASSLDAGGPEVLDASTLPDAEVPAPDPGGLECAQALLAIPPQAWHAEGRVDPAHELEIETAARTCLSRYLRLDTTNPPADGQPGELAAVRFFETVFAKLGLPTRRTPMSMHPDPKRLSLIATRAGARAAGSVVLLNHSDVVAATGTWTHPPFGGDDDGTFVWGRGALDMKGVGISQLVALAVLHRAGVPLGRDVHFVAVADEEVNGEGAQFVAQSSDLKPGIILNEGGDGVRDALADGRDFFLIGVEEKGAVWSQVAHADAARLVVAIAKAGILKTPEESTYADADTRTSLGAACKLVGLSTGAAQKTNVQPMHVDATLRCQPGLQSKIESATANAGAGMIPAPALKVTSVADGAEELVALSIDTAAGGHGAVSASRNALDVAVSALVSTGQWDPAELAADSGAGFFSFGLSPANQELVGQLARQWGMTPGEAAAFLASNPALAETLLDVGHGALPTDSIFRTTCSWTNFQFPVAGEARAKLDCRVDFQHPEGAKFRADLEAFLAAWGVVDRSTSADCYDCHAGDFNGSPFGPASLGYATVRRQLELSSPDVVAAAYLFPASSDSATFRALGVPTYGIWPAAMTQAELETMHSVDERVPVAEVVRAIRVYARTISGLANDAPPPPRDDAHRLGAGELQCAKRDLFGWTAAATPELKCEVLSTTWHCTAAAGAPRFLRAAPEGKDAHVYSIQRLTADWTEAAGEPDPSQIDRVLFQARGSGSAPCVRVFEGQEFEIDTGLAATRQFLLRCDTPANVDLLDARIRFYRD